MLYQVTTTFNQTIDRVIQGFIDLEMMKQWQPHLVEIQAESSVWPKTGFIGYLMYDVTGIKSKMKVTIESNELPNQLVLIYEVPGVYNRCAYYFEEKGHQTDYRMDVVFTFEDGVERPEALFKAETTRIMAVFKQYIEGL
jgi:hypothetical protein